MRADVGVWLKARCCEAGSVRLLRPENHYGTGSRLLTIVGKTLVSANFSSEAGVMLFNDIGTQATGMSAGPAILDPDIREALVEKRLEPRARRSGALVIHELGLAHAKRRVDVAVINGEIHGFEIKSAQDRLDRLPGQIEVYRRSLHRLTLVVAARHVKRVLEIIPSWCGVLKVLVGTRGEISFESVQKTKKNPSVDPFILAHLLWRNEVQEILSEYGAQPATLRAPRAELYRLLVTKTTEPKLTGMIKAAMTERTSWRDCPLLS